MNWTGERKDKFAELLGEGKSLKEIAKYFGITYDNLRWAKSTYKIGEKLSKARNNEALEKLSKRDIASRILELKGEFVKKGDLGASFSDEQLRKWFSGVVGVDQFCRDVLDVQLQDYQLQMCKLMLERRRCVFVLGRQTGKDFTIACFVLWLSVTKPNQKVLLVSAAQRQSDLLLNRVIEHIAANTDLFDSVSRSNMEVIEFTNGSKVYSLPSTAYIRGYTEVTHVFLNEVAFGIEEGTLSAVEPMLAIKRGNLVMVSSPAGTSGVLWDAFNNPVYAKLQLPSSVNKYISKNWLEDQKKTMSSISYDCEYNANFSEAIDSFFKVETVNACTKDYSLRSTGFEDPEKEFYVGIDWGRIQDSSVVTIVSKDSDEQLKVEAIIEMDKTPFKEQEERIKLLAKEWRIEKIVSEYAGLSINSCENLERSGLDVDFFKPTLDSKQEAYNYLLKQMEDGLLTIPKHAKLQYELRVFKFEINSQGKMKLHHIAGGSDDFVDSLCYAVWATDGGSESYGAPIW